MYTSGLRELGQHHRSSHSSWEPVATRDGGSHTLARHSQLPCRLIFVLHTQAEAQDLRMRLHCRQAFQGDDLRGWENGAVRKVPRP